MAAASVDGRFRPALEPDGLRLADVALAGCLAVFAQVNLHFNLDNSTPYGSQFAAAVAVAFATVALAWRRRRPLTTLCVVVAATAGPELFTRLTFTLWGHFVPLLIAVYALARWSTSRRDVAIGVALTLAAVVLLMLRLPSVGTAANIPFSLVPITVALVAGQVQQRREHRQVELAARA